MKIKSNKNYVITGKHYVNIPFKRTEYFSYLDIIIKTNNASE